MCRWSARWAHHGGGTSIQLGFQEITINKSEAKRLRTGEAKLRPSFYVTRVFEKLFNAVGHEFARPFP
jgi:hypothetical protein